MTDTTLLSWINAEVERALGLVQESIAKYSAAPDTAATITAITPNPAHSLVLTLRSENFIGAPPDGYPGRYGGLSDLRRCVATSQGAPGESRCKAIAYTAKACASPATSRSKTMRSRSTACRAGRDSSR